MTSEAFYSLRARPGLSFTFQSAQATSCHLHWAPCCEIWGMCVRFLRPYWLDIETYFGKVSPGGPVQWLVHCGRGTLRAVVEVSKALCGSVTGRPQACGRTQEWGRREGTNNVLSGLLVRTWAGLKPMQRSCHSGTFHSWKPQGHTCERVSP